MLGIYPAMAEISVTQPTLIVKFSHCQALAYLELSQYKIMNVEWTQPRIVLVATTTSGH